MKQNTLYTLIVWGLGLLLLNACADQEVGSTIPVPENGKIQMTMNVRNASFELPTTRASADENAIDDIYVLVFEKQNTSETIDETALFVEAAKVINTGTVRILELDKREDTECNVLVIVNPKGNIYYGDTEINLSAANPATELEAAISTTATLSDVCENLLTKPFEVSVSTTKAVPYADQKLPMAGIASVDEIVDSGIIQADLYRSLAKAIVKVKTGGITDFELLGITIIQTPIQGQFWRLGDELKDNSNAGDRADFYYSGTTNADMLVDAVDDSTADNPVYLYESCKEEGETFIIIKGEYKGNVGYFKLGIQEDDGTHLDIKRNTNYEITITDVNYRGFDNIQDAILATIPNLVYSITSTEQGTHDIVSDGYMYMAFNCSKLIYVGPNGYNLTDVAFEILTNSTVDYNANKISVKSGEMTIRTAPTNNLKVVVSDGSNLGSTKITIRLGTNFTIGEILVEYGSLVHTLTVERPNTESYPPFAGGTKQFTGYRGELVTKDPLDNIFLSLDDAATSGTEEILSYGDFYLHVDEAPSDIFGHEERQIALYISSADNFNGRTKYVICQSDN